MGQAAQLAPNERILLLHPKPHTSPLHSAPKVLGKVCAQAGFKHAWQCANTHPLVLRDP